MTFFDAVLSGLVQGLTEFIPVSSSGHLELLKEVFGISGSFENDVLLNIGTILAALVYFRQRLRRALHQVFIESDFDYATKLVLATLPAVIVGFLFYDWFQQDQVRSLGVVIFTLSAGGLIMILVDRFVKVEGEDEVSERSALMIGLAQVLALIPGVSRSGSTIVAARANKVSYHEAVEFSFIIGMPLILGAVFSVLITDEGQRFIRDNTGAFIVGNVVAFIAGMAAISLMVNFTKKLGLKWFGIYRILLAGLLFLLVF